MTYFVCLDTTNNKLFLSPYRNGCEIFADSGYNPEYGAIFEYINIRSGTEHYALHEYALTDSVSRLIPKHKSVLFCSSCGHPFVINPQNVDRQLERVPIEQQMCRKCLYLHRNANLLTHTIS